MSVVPSCMQSTPGTANSKRATTMSCQLSKMVPVDWGPSKTLIALWPFISYSNNNYIMAHAFYALSDSSLWFILTPKSSIFPEITFRHPSKQMLKHPTMPGISSVLLYSLRTWGIIAMKPRTLQSNQNPHAFLVHIPSHSTPEINVFQHASSLPKNPTVVIYTYFWSLRKHQKTLTPWLSPSQQCLANRCSRPRPKGTRSASMSH